MSKILLTLLAVVIFAAGIITGIVLYDKYRIWIVTDYHKCVMGGFPIIETHPAECRAGNKTFADPDAKLPQNNTNNQTQSNPNITVTSPLPNTQVTSPLTITGQAKGWYYEASFSVKLLDGNNNVVTTGLAEAQSDWMTSNFVPFVATLNFSTPTTSTGTLVLIKDNQSGLPQNDDSISIPVTF